MKRSMSISIVLSLMLTAIDWVSASHGQSTAKLAVAASTDSCIQVGRIVSVQGEVQLKRKGWSDYHPTAVDALLCLGDLLRPAKGARVVVDCADPNQNSWTVPQGVPSGAAIGCRPRDKPIHTITGPLFKSIRTGNDCQGHRTASSGSSQVGKSVQGASVPVLTKVEYLWQGVGATPLCRGARGKVPQLTRGNLVQQK